MREGPQRHVISWGPCRGRAYDQHSCQPSLVTTALGLGLHPANEGATGTMELPKMQ